jgi:hypothetical protein
MSSSPYDEVQSPKKVLEIVTSVLFWVSFVIWKVAYAPNRFAAFHLLMNPTVLGACLAGLTLFISFQYVRIPGIFAKARLTLRSCLDAYFLSYIQVVYNTPISQAGYIYNIHAIGACCSAILTGM